MDEQSDHPLTISLVDRDDGRQTSSSETTAVTREELDKYCRGERMLLTGSLMLVEKDLGGATVPFDESHRIFVNSIQQKIKDTGGIPDLEKFDEEFFQTCTRQGIPVARHFIVGAHLRRGIDSFYREDPPDYQALLDGLMEVARFHDASIPASARIHAFNPRERVFEQVPPVEAALFLRRKYAERQDSAYDAITRLLSLMKKETGSVGVMMDAPVEE